MKNESNAIMPDDFRAESRRRWRRVARILGGWVLVGVLLAQGVKLWL